MKSLLFKIFAAGLMVFLLSFELFGQLPRPKEAYFSAQGYRQLNGVNGLFEGLGKAEIESLKYRPNLNISVYAAWVLCEQNCKSKGIESDKAMQLSFADFLSGRLNCKVPDWWKQEMGQHLFRKGILSGMLGEFVEYDFKKTNEIRHPLDLTLHVLDKNKLRVSKAGKEYSVNWDRDDGEYTLDEILTSVDLMPLTDGGILFCIADYNAVFLCRRDEKGRTLWQRKFSSKVQRALLGRRPFSNNSFSKIAISNGNVCVFGGNSTGKYVGSYELSTGDVVLEFTTFFSLADKNSKESNEEGKTKGIAPRSLGKEEDTDVN